MIEVERDQALAFRVAGHNLHRRTDPLTAIAACGIQEYPPGWAAVALAARSKQQPRARDVVVVNAMRGSPYLIPRRDLAVFTAALVPADDGVAALIGSRVAKEVRAAGYEPREALDRVSAAAREGLADGPLDRDDFHQAMRERLPDDLLPWCRGCESHHVRPTLWRALGPIGVTRMDGRGRWALAKPPRANLERARAEFGRRFLRAYGPATHTQLAGWAQTAPAHAKAIVESISDELEQVRIGRSKGWVLAEDRRRLESPPKATGVRMLGGHDPYIAQPDRDSLVADKPLRKRMFPAIGRPGTILDRGRLAGLWKGRKRGETLAIDVEWLGGAVELGREPRGVAQARACDEVEVSER